MSFLTKFVEESHHPSSLAIRGRDLHFASHAAMSPDLVSTTLTLLIEKGSDK